MLTPRALDSFCALSIMAKAPKAGSVKTRLVPPLTHEEAAALNVCFLKDTAANIGEFTHSHLCEGVAVYTPEGTEHLFHELLPSEFKLLLQRGEGFGARLFHAAKDLLATGYGSVCLIDSDSPTLPQAALATAITALSRAGDRIVLGPAEDGGYYLIGLKQAHARLFMEIEWSTEKVLTQTMERAQELNLEIVLLPFWYDVDERASLRQLCNELFGSRRSDSVISGGYQAPHTRSYLAGLIAESDGRIWAQAPVHGTELL